MCIRDSAKKLLQENRIEKLVVTDNNNKCIGLITVKDIQRGEKFPYSVKDKNGQLLVGAAIGSKISTIDTISYGAFIIPGLVMLSVMTTSVNFAAGFTRGIFKIYGFFDRFE